MSNYSDRLGPRRDLLESMETLLPERLREAHARRRTGYPGQTRTPSMGASLELHGRRNDRTEFRVAISLSPLKTEDGIGICEDDEAQLFQAFAQLGSGSTRRDEGTGPGLYLSQKLAELIGAELSFTSSHGAGSTFTLQLGAPETNREG